jgi:hypothetical protein
MNRVRQFILVWSIFAVFSFWTQVSVSQDKRERPLAFKAIPKKTLFKSGEDIILIFSLTNRSNEPIFVSRLKTDDFVDVELTAPNGRAAPWHGRGRIDSKQYDPADFVILKPGEKLNGNRIISLKDGQGYLVKQPGRYSVKAQYSLGPSEYFAPIAGSAHIPDGSFPSPQSSFCVESCNSTTDTTR